jgi:hypothetical protein
MAVWPRTSEIHRFQLYTRRRSCEETVRGDNTLGAQACGLSVFWYDYIIGTFTCGQYEHGIFNEET